MDTVVAGELYKFPGFLCSSKELHFGIKYVLLKVVKVNQWHNFRLIQKFLVKWVMILIQME